eukprot:999197-Prorocentrum_minimum.AAC.1
MTGARYNNARGSNSCNVREFFQLMARLSASVIRRIRLEAVPHSRIGKQLAVWFRPPALAGGG